MDKKQQSNTTQKKNKIKENEKRVLVSAQRITDIKSINDDVEILTLNSAWKIAFLCSFRKIISLFSLSVTFES